MNYREYSSNGHNKIVYPRSNNTLDNIVTALHLPPYFSSSLPLYSSATLFPHPKNQGYPHTKAATHCKSGRTRLIPWLVGA